MQRITIALCLLALAGLTADAQTSLSRAATRVEGIVAAPPGLDSDRDGFLDNEEFVAGTDAHNPDSFLAVYAGDLLSATTGLVVVWPSVEHRRYRLLHTTNLFQGFLSAVATNIAAVPPANVHTDRTATGEGPHYYRVGVEEPKRSAP